jgi:hypothetical protein
MIGLVVSPGRVVPAFENEERVIAKSVTAKVE